MQHTLFVVVAPLAAAISIAVAIYAWRYRASPGASALTWHMIAISGWLMMNTASLLFQTESLVFLFGRLSYWFIVSVPVTGFAFALQYTGRRWWLAFPRFLVFCIVPIVTALLVQTTGWNNLVWQRYEFVQLGHLTSLRVNAYGPWFWVHAAYSYTLSVAGVLLVVAGTFRSFSIYRRQATWVLLGAFAPLAVNAIFVFRLIPGLRQDYSPISLSVGGVLFAIGIFRLRLFDLRPIARNVLVDNMSDGMIVLDKKYRIVDINPAAQVIFDVVGDAAVGQPAAQVLPIWGDVAGRIQDSPSEPVEISLSQDGRRTTFDARISPLISRGSRYAGYLITLHDITHRKHAQEEQEKLIEELDAFAHTVAHDLRNPLTSIDSLIELLREALGESSDDKQELYLRVMEQSVTKSFSIIRELMLLSGVRAIARPEICPVDMAHITADALQRLEPMVQKYRAEIIVPEVWPSVIGYTPWIEEVWINYLSNALKYGGQPPVIELGADARNGNLVRFWVRDNGPGILPDDQAKLFTPFTRLSQVDLEGHGLGLSIVRRIIEKLGGEAGMESEMGKGSTFFFTLPGQCNTSAGRNQ